MSGHNRDDIIQMQPCDTLTSVSVHQQAEPSVQDRDNRFRTLMDNLEQAVFLKDQDLRFTAVNRRFCEELRREEADILGRTDLDFYPPELAHRYRQDDRLVLQGQRLEHEETNPSRTGSERRVHVIKTPVLDGQGRIGGVLGIFWDVTERQRLNDHLRRTQKMEAIGQLASGVAHDFNNVLTGILGNLALVQMQVRDPAIKELVGIAEQAAWRAVTLTGQLLGFSRKSVLRTEPHLLNQTVEEVVALVQRTLDPRIRLETRKAENLWLVQADSGQMSQVLMNLCLNARDAILEVINHRQPLEVIVPSRGPAGERLVEGFLRLETSNVEMDRGVGPQRPDSEAAHHYVRLRITDTGCGITPEAQTRIFEPFFTTKGPGKGTGLGLAMVFGIVQQHHGWIDCSSTVGVGTTFDLYLPRCLAATREEEAPAFVPPDGGSETILFADDDANLRSLGRLILQRHGYQVILAEDGVSAVESYRAHHAEIALVILDLTMPRLSGRDALQLIRQINPHVRVILTSGYSADYLAEECRREIQCYVAKPFRPDALARTVREVLDRVMPGEVRLESWKEVVLE